MKAALITVTDFEKEQVVVEWEERDNPIRALAHIKEAREGAESMGGMRHLARAIVADWEAMVAFYGESVAAEKMGKQITEEDWLRTLGIPTGQAPSGPGSQGNGQ